MSTKAAVLATDSKQTAEHAKIYSVDAAIPGGSPAFHFVKRCMDLVGSLLLMIILSIPMLVIALAIRLDSAGPALFRQERLGKNGKAFIIWKFRSMRMDAESTGPQWAEAEDDRCTHLGKCIRKFRIDEFPQLWNIFIGEMSFVGPRPERAYFYDEFETYIRGFRNRLAVKPGLTGLAQINGGYDLKPEEKIVYDMEYIQNQSLLLDLQCILKTARLFFTHTGAR